MLISTQHIHTELQDIIIEKYTDDLRLILDGDLQFSFKEDTLYTSAMTKIPMGCLWKKREIKVLILWGGDGFIADTLRNYPNITSIDLCELDRWMIELCSTNADITSFNHGVFSDPKVRIHIEDALVYVKKNLSQQYDLIIADFPDAHSRELAKLYAKEFYEDISRLLTPEGVFVTLGTEVRYTKKCFECIIKTLNTVFPYSYQYSVLMPETYGEMGIGIASKTPINILNSEIKTYTPIMQDIVEINTIENTIAYWYFREWTESSGFIPGVTNNQFI